jgi:hypothetical protein
LTDKISTADLGVVSNSVNQKINGSLPNFNGMNSKGGV